MLVRCGWVPENDQLYEQYHDQEWGVPVHDDRLHFEFLTLEGFQAGLSWRTILMKRENFRIAFDNFDPAAVAVFDEARTLMLLSNPGIVRNRLKVRAAVENARRFLEIQEQFPSFDEYIWRFVGGKTRRNEFHSIGEIPARTEQSDVMSKDLLKRGFRFVGSTICYAYMQATGMVNDHTVDCFRHSVLDRPGV